MIPLDHEKQLFDGSATTELDHLVQGRAQRRRHPIRPGLGWTDLERPERSIAATAQLDERARGPQRPLLGDENDSPLSKRAFLQRLRGQIDRARQSTVSAHPTANKATVETRENVP